MKILGNEIKPGMLIEHKNDLWEVLKTQHVKPGKGGAFNQVEMKSVNKKQLLTKLILIFFIVMITNIFLLIKKPLSRFQLKKI